MPSALIPDSTGPECTPEPLPGSWRSRCPWAPPGGHRVPCQGACTLSPSTEVCRPRGILSLVPVTQSLCVWAGGPGQQPLYVWTRSLGSATSSSHVPRRSSVMTQSQLRVYCTESSSELISLIKCECFLFLMKVSRYFRDHSMKQSCVTWAGTLGLTPRDRFAVPAQARDRKQHSL